MSEEIEILNEEEYEPDLIDLEDEDGNVTTFEIIDGMEYEGTNYFALIPYTNEEDSEDSEEDEFVILKEIQKSGESYLASIDDDNEYEKIGAMFIDRFSELFPIEE